MSRISTYHVRNNIKPFITEKEAKEAGKDIVPVHIVAGLGGLHELNNQGAGIAIPEGFKYEPGNVFVPVTGNLKGQPIICIAGGASVGDYDLAPLVDALNYDENTVLKLETVPSAHGFHKSLTKLLVGFGLAHYEFDQHKAGSSKPKPQMMLTSQMDQSVHDEVTSTVEGICLLRDLINRSPNDLTPEALMEEVEMLSQQFNARATLYCDAPEDDRVFGGPHEPADRQDMMNRMSAPAPSGWPAVYNDGRRYQPLQDNFPAIHEVGKASENKPGLVDMVWGDESHPKLTLVGKGITFDSGGLNVKGANSMVKMKKDMGGAAHAIGLARIIMGLNLPVRLRLIVPTAENAIAGNAYRPSDVIRTAKGLNVEIDNTDAEGRLILADALHLASSDNPDLIINYATLTGGARVAYGRNAPALFAADTDLGRELEDIGFDITGDKLQHTRYDAEIEAVLKSATVADLVNASPANIGGSAIQAAEFLKQFVGDAQRFVHIDTYAWSDSSKPGQPKGGADKGLRTVLHFAKQRYKKRQIITP